MTDSSTPVPVWLRGWALWTALSALPLVFLGAEVTTKKAGMADPVGIRNPLYLFEREADVPGQPVRFWHLWQTGQFRLLIEHSHRLFGFLVGLNCIVLAIGLGWAARGWYRWLGLLAGLAVAPQGILGILRVNWNLPAGDGLAFLHGCLAQLVFAVLVTVPVLLSNCFAKPASGLPRWVGWAAVGIAALVYTQVVFGAALRHLTSYGDVVAIAQRVHVLLAFAAVVGVLWLCYRVREMDHTRVAVVLTALLIGLVLIQPVFGVEAWIRRFGSLTLPDEVPSTFGGDLVRSGHHILGTLIFSCTVGLTAILFRPRAASSSSALLHARAKEGIA